MDAAVTLGVLAEYAKQDLSYRERLSMGTTRWHATIDGADFEVLCTGPKFYDLRTRRGGGGAVDLAMCLLGISFKQAVKTLRERGV